MQVGEKPAESLHCPIGKLQLFQRTVIKEKKKARLYNRLVNSVSYTRIENDLACSTNFAFGFMSVLVRV